MNDLIMSEVRRRLAGRVQGANGDSRITVLTADARDLLKRIEELEAENRRLRAALDASEAAYHTFDAGKGRWA